MSKFLVDPLTDRRWDDFVATHPRASVFHHRGWLKALEVTYGYRPVALTSTSPGEPLRNSIVFCEIRSRLTGNRLVSLPFSDHADPLLNDQADFSMFVDWMEEECRVRKWKYCELRPFSLTLDASARFAKSQWFWSHVLDLTPSLGTIFSGMHKSCIQRRTKRAEREHLTYEKGCTPQIIEDFYSLTQMTRRRHKLLPQPKTWFQNVVAYMGTDVMIRLIRKDRIAIAGVLTLKHGQTVVYKYGCSDERFHRLSGMPLLFWRLIEESKANGASQIDLGRTEPENSGLLTFKDRLGAFRQRVCYLRYPGTTAARALMESHLSGAKRLISMLPNAICPLAGRFVYRHLG